MRENSTFDVSYFSGGLPANKFEIIIKLFISRLYDLQKTLDSANSEYLSLLAGKLWFIFFDEMHIDFLLTSIKSMRSKK